MAVSKLQMQMPIKIKRETHTITDEVGHIFIPIDGNYFPVLASSWSNQACIKFRYMYKSTGSGLDIWLAAGAVDSTMTIMTVYVNTSLLPFAI